MNQQEIRLMNKPWVRNLIAFSAGLFSLALMIGIPLLAWRPRISNYIISIIIIGFFAAPFASGIICGIIVHEKRRSWHLLSSKWSRRVIHDRI